VPFEGETEKHTYQNDLANLIGKICLDWSSLEALLARQYVLLVFGDHNFSDTSQVTVIEAFESLPTWRTKCVLLQAAAERRLGKTKAQELGKLLGKFEGAQKRRNNAVHGLWFTARDSPGVWVRTRGRFGQADAWDPDTFWQLRYDILQGMKSLNSFFEEVWKALKDGKYKLALAVALDDFNTQKDENTVES
jgi:hypothetical protein